MHTAAATPASSPALFPQDISDQPAQDFDISRETLKRAARAKYGNDVLVSEPQWVDHEHVRVGIHLPACDASFGADFFYRTGHFE